MYGTCDVPGCTNETYMGWRPLSQPLGKQICEYHFRRHDDPADSFNLWEAFGFRRSAKMERSAPKKDIPRCACGHERLPRRRFCTMCAQQRERERKKGAYHERKNRQEKSVEAEPTLRCRACGEPREAGHTYCRRCAEDRRKRSNRERRRRCYHRAHKCVGLM